jgi:hypothetical protein
MSKFKVISLPPGSRFDLRTYIKRLTAKRLISVSKAVPSIGMEELCVRLGIARPR